MAIRETLRTLLGPGIVVEQGDVDEPRTQRLDVLRLVLDLAQQLHEQSWLDLFRIVVNQVRCVRRAHFDDAVDPLSLDLLAYRENPEVHFQAHLDVEIDKDELVAAVVVPGVHAHAPFRQQAISLGRSPYHARDWTVEPSHAMLPSARDRIAIDGLRSDRPF